MYRNILILAFVIALFPMGYGQEEKPDINDVIKRYDKNGDGKLSCDEFPNAEAFKNIDADQDGFISKEELKQHHENRPKEPGQKKSREELFKENDKNQDGKIGKDEWKGPPNFFEKLDKNQDGFLTKEEFPPRQVPNENGQMNEKVKHFKDQYTYWLHKLSLGLNLIQNLN